MSDKLFRISTPTIKYTIDDEFDMSRVASSRFIICNMGNKNRIVKENPTIEGMAFRTDLTQEETKKLNAGVISAQIHILLNNHKVIWTDIAKTTMNGVLGEDMFDVPDYSADTGEYEIDFHGTVSDYDVPLHGHLDVTLEGSTVIPNPEGEATDDLTKVEIDGEIFLVKDSTIHDWARAEEKPTYTKDEVGLGNVDNTSDLNKPISTATQTALDGKVDKDGDKVLSDNNYSDTDKTKLDGIEEQANKTVVDNSVTATSTNPVESKAIYNLLNDLLPEATETGNPIAISNASGFNAKALTVDMLPIQDLHGYDKPWAGGSGKNLVDYPNVTIPSNGGFVFNTSYSGESGDYTVSFDFNADNSGQLLFRLYSGSTVVGEKTANYSSGTSRVVATATASQNFDSWRAYVNQSGSVSKIMVAKGSYSIYEPYENICPISGRTQTEIEVNGETTTIQFGQTVYGGTCDVVNGGTSEDWFYIEGKDFPTNGLIISSQTTDTVVFQIAVSYLGGACATPYASNIISNRFSTSIPSGTAGRMVMTATVFYFVLNKSELQTIDAEGVHTWFVNNPSQFCYKRTTQTTLITPATSISLNKGNNTLSTSGDNMDLKYSKIPQ